MSYLLRMVKRNLWYPDHPRKPTSGRPHADALADLATINNTLSFWKVDGSTAATARVIVALAAQRDHASKFEYVLLDESKVSGLELDLQPSRGRSADSNLNEHSHVDAVGLTSDQVCGLARSILADGQIDRKREKEMKELLGAAFKTGRLERSEMNQNLLRKLASITSRD